MRSVVSADDQRSSYSWSSVNVSNMLIPSEVTKRVIAAAESSKADGELLYICNFLNALLVAFPKLNVAKHVLRELVPVILTPYGEKANKEKDEPVEEEIEQLLKNVAWRATVLLKNVVHPTEFKQLVSDYT